MLRTLALALVAVNGVFLAWNAGWLGALAPLPPALQGREPGRLEQQVRPEALTVLRPRAAAAALAVQEAASAAAASTASGAASAPR
jgi:hypothetical protein